MRPQLAPEIDATLRDGWTPVYRSQLHYLVTWSTRGRRPVLRERHIEVVRTLVERACAERSHTLLEVAAGADHVHVLIGLRPTHSVASVVRELKGRTAIALLDGFPELRVWLRGNLVWAEPYSVETVSARRVAHVAERLRTMHEAHDHLAQAS